MGRFFLRRLDLGTNATKEDDRAKGIAVLRECGVALAPEAIVATLLGLRGVFAAPFGIAPLSRRCRAGATHRRRGAIAPALRARSVYLAEFGERIAAYGQSPTACSRRPAIGHVSGANAPVLRTAGSANAPALRAHLVSSRECGEASRPISLAYAYASARVNRPSHPPVSRVTAQKPCARATRKRQQRDPIFVDFHAHQGITCTPEALMTKTRARPPLDPSLQDASAVAKLVYAYLKLARGERNTREITDDLHLSVRGARQGLEQLDDRNLIESRVETTEHGRPMYYKLR